MDGDTYRKYNGTCLPVEPLPLALDTGVGQDGKERVARGGGETVVDPLEFYFFAYHVTLGPWERGNARSNQPARGANEVGVSITYMSYLCVARAHYTYGCTLSVFTSGLFGPASEVGWCSRAVIIANIDRFKFIVECRFEGLVLSSLRSRASVEGGCRYGLFPPVRYCSLCRPPAIN